MKGTGRVGKTIVFAWTTLCTLAAVPQTVFAFQAHGGPEGLYVHQGAHLFLILSLIIFLFNIRRSRLEAEKAWRLLSAGALLLTIWNTWAFAGHVVETFIPESMLVVLPDRVVPSLQVNSWREAAYYVLKMDHLLCLPALIFFCAGLRKLHSSFQENGTGKKGGRP